MCVTTHSAVSSTGQDPQVVDFAIQLQARRLIIVNGHFSQINLTSLLDRQCCSHVCACVRETETERGRETYPSFGPPWLRSNTCRGFRYHMKDCRILLPCKTSRQTINPQSHRSSQAPHPTCRVLKSWPSYYGFYIQSGLIFHVSQGQNEVNTSCFNFFSICRDKMELICSLFGPAWSPSPVCQVHCGLDFWHHDVTPDVAVG